jgi:hypothetical protein
MKNRVISVTEENKERKGNYDAVKNWEMVNHVNFRLIFSLFLFINFSKNFGNNSKRI